MKAQHASHLLARAAGVTVQLLCLAVVVGAVAALTGALHEARQAQLQEAFDRGLRQGRAEADAAAIATAEAGWSMAHAEAERCRDLSQGTAAPAER